MQSKPLRTINLALRGLTLVSKFLLLFLLARFLEPSQIGLYGLLAATVSYSLFLVGFDFYTYTTRELLKHDISERGRLIKNQTALSGVLYVGVAPVLALIFVAGVLPPALALWFASLLVVEHIGQELNRILVTLSEQLVASFVLFFRAGLWALAAVALMIVEPKFRALNTVFGLWLIGGTAACALGVWKLSQLRMGGWEKSVDWAWVKRGFKVAAPLLIATLALRALFTLDRYWVGALGGLEVLGAYVLFMGMSAALMSFLDAGVFVFSYPRLILAAHERDSEQFRQSMRSLSTQTLVLASGFCLFALVSVRPLLAWIDRPVYLRHEVMFSWVLIAMLLHAAGMIPHYGLYAQGHDRPIIQSHLGAFGMFVLATSALVPFQGALAVPIGLCVAFCGILIWKSWAYLRLTPADLRGVHVDIRRSN